MGAQGHRRPNGKVGIDGKVWSFVEAPPEESTGSAGGGSDSKMDKGQRARKECDSDDGRETGKKKKAGKSKSKEKDKRAKRKRKKEDQKKKRKKKKKSTSSSTDSTDESSG